jgi:dihydrofolate synthase/folylpolyglutamate synthase
MMTDNPHIDALLERLYNPDLRYIDLSLDRIERLLTLLGTPHKKIPPVIHVAGTNGKGSLIANLQAIFEAAGYTPHRYISPHLIRFNERIIVRGHEIGDDYLESLLQRILELSEMQKVTFFEALTAAAFLAFSENTADVVLLETGLGGRLDATNVIEAPILTAITPIALDHCKCLGNTITAIAGEKAGILKPGVTSVVGRQRPEATRVIGDRAAEIYAPLYPLGVDWNWEFYGERARYRSSRREVVFATGLVGAHQYDNAATAIACFDNLPQFRVNDAQIISGLANVAWPGRLHHLAKHRYQKLLPRHCELWLDGGHNPQGGEILADWLKLQNREVHLICGMLRDKDSLGYFKPLAPYVMSVTAIPIPGEKDSQPASTVADAARAAGINVLIADSIEKALQSLPVRATNPAIVVICGSLYLAGYVLAVK